MYFFLEFICEISETLDLTKPLFLLSIVIASDIGGYIVGKLFGNIEFKRCACESEFYKYVIDTGSDIGIKNKQINTQTYFYDIDDEFKERKDFKK